MSVDQTYQETPGFLGEGTVPRRFLDGHISDRHFLDRQILDKAISRTLFRQVNKTGHFLDWTYFRHTIKVDTF